MKIRAPAKLNLRLSVLAREASGYHQIETVFCALELADTLTLRRAAGELHLRVEGAALGPVEENLVHRAARAFYDEADRDSGVRIELDKRIPVGAGLGGGSSDAAATLMALNRLHDEPLSGRALLGLGARLGSDVPFFLTGLPLALAWGRGERLLPLPPLPAAPVLLAVPDFGVSTPEAYRALDAYGVDAELEPRIAHIDELGSWSDVAALAANDLEDVAFRMHPLLARIKAALAETGARAALLTGTGSVVFGVYADVGGREEAAAVLAGEFPDVRWIRTTTVGADRG